MIGILLIFVILALAQSPKSRDFDFHPMPLNDYVT